jgi:hypothetical protein
MGTVKQNGKVMKMQKCNSGMKCLSCEATAHGITGIHTCTGIVVPMQTPTQTNTVVLKNISNLLVSKILLPLRCSSTLGCIKMIEI